MYLAPLNVADPESAFTNIMVPPWTRHRKCPISHKEEPPTSGRENEGLKLLPLPPSGGHSISDIAIAAPSTKVQTRTNERTSLTDPKGPSRGPVAIRNFPYISGSALSISRLACPRSRVGASGWACCNFPISQNLTHDVQSRSGGPSPSRK